MPKTRLPAAPTVRIVSEDGRTTDYTAAELRKMANQEARHWDRRAIGFAVHFRETGRASLAVDLEGGTQVGIAI